MEWIIYSLFGAVVLFPTFMAFKTWLHFREVFHPKHFHFDFSEMMS
jgi:hypothetical protein